MFMGWTQIFNNIISNAGYGDIKDSRPFYSIAELQYMRSKHRRFVALYLFILLTFDKKFKRFIKILYTLILISFFFKEFSTLHVIALL